MDSPGESCPQRRWLDRSQPLRRAGIKTCLWTSGPNYGMFWALRRESGRGIRRALQTNHVQTRSPETEHDGKPRPQRADPTETRPNPCYQLGTKGPSWLEQTEVADARGCSTCGDRLGGEHPAGWEQWRVSEAGKSATGCQFCIPGCVFPKSTSKSASRWKEAHSPSVMIKYGMRNSFIPQMTALHRCVPKQ